MISDTVDPFRLRSRRVDLAVHLLEQEVQLAAAGLGAVGERLPVLQVPAEPDHLLGDVGPAHEPGDLLREERLVHEGVGAQLADTLVQPGLQACDAAMSGRGRLGEQLRQEQPARVQVGAQVPSFRSAHRIELVERFVEGGFHQRPELRQVGVRLGDALADGERLGKPQQVARRHRTRHVALLPRAFDRTAERGEELLVQLDVERRRPALLHAHHDLHPSARHPFLHEAPEPGLERSDAGGDAELDVQESMVHRLHRRADGRRLVFARQ